MMRFVPPAGVPLKMTRVLRALRIAVSSNGRLEACLPSVAAILKVKHVFGASSGRAALWVILKSLQSLKPERDVVAIPAYTCFSVAASIVRAGLKIHPIEINPQTLDFDFSQMDLLSDKKLLCVIPSNLFGFQSDLSRVTQIARSRGAFVLDDAAQALGATLDGEFAGTLGDVGFYSLGRGKAVSTMKGGLIVTNSDEIARAIQLKMNTLGHPSLGSGASLFSQMLTYSLFLRPRLYWVPNSMPFLQLGVTEFDPGFPTEELHSLSRALLPGLFDELQEFNEIRQANAKAIMKGIGDNPRFWFPKPALDTQPTYVRLPIVARDKIMRDQAVNRLRYAGIGASAFYPSAICDIPGIASHIATGDFHCPHAEVLSETLLTLPVNPYVNSQDIERMVGILNTL
jgi:dTDP-4-amino-4,6-dideoxygalactose transaminase